MPSTRNTPNSVFLLRQMRHMLKKFRNAEDEEELLYCMYILKKQIAVAHAELMAS